MSARKLNSSFESDDPLKVNKSRSTRLRKATNNASIYSISLHSSEDNRTDNIKSVEDLSILDEIPKDSQPLVAFPDEIPISPAPQYRNPAQSIPSPISTLHSSLYNSLEFQTKCHQYSDVYIENCKRFNINIDPSVVIALRTGWSVLQPTRKFSEGSMLPLMGILESCESITKVNLSNVAMIDQRYKTPLNPFKTHHHPALMVKYLP